MNKQVPIETVQDMYDYYCEGHSLKATGRKFKRSNMVVWYHFNKNGFAIRPNAEAVRVGWGIEAETRAMYEEYLTGLSCAKIAAKYGYNKAVTIYSRFKRYGLKTRTPKEAKNFAKSS